MASRPTRSDVPEPPLPRLKPLQVFGLTQPVALVEGRLTVGRADDNDLVLSGEVFPSVSTHHARLDFEDGTLFIEDLGSRNGTLVGETAILGRVALKAGDVVQFGPIGPRFVVISSQPLEETMFVSPDAARRAAVTDSLSETRVARIREALGVPEDVGGVDELVRRRSRRTLARVLVVALMLVTAAAIWTKRLMRRSEQSQSEAAAHTEAELERLREEFGRDHRALVETLDSVRVEERQRDVLLSQLRTDSEKERERLGAERSALLARLDQLEQGGSSSSESIEEVRSQLEETREALSMLDPVNLQNERLARVRGVRKSIVLIEATIRLRNTENDRLLYESPDGMPNFDDLGEPFGLESTGSGFCVSEEGWILTNAHVVVLDEEDETLASLKGTPIIPELELAAVFSDESTRHPAEIVQVVYDDVEDLALVKIEPFEGMPYIEDFDLEAPPPSQLDSVFLFGFPLGNFVLQQGETVIASAFRGIVSRSVGGRLQVDAGVHPGNSGGPVTDGDGHVVGIVVSVQVEPTTGQNPVYTIGYAIPIANAAKVWPPPAEWGAAIAEEASEGESPSAQPAATGPRDGRD